MKFFCRAAGRTKTISDRLAGHRLKPNRIWQFSVPTFFLQDYLHSYEREAVEVEIWEKAEELGMNSKGDRVHSETKRNSILTLRFVR